MAIRLDEDVRAVLEASTITDAEVRLPGEQLERNLYLKVAKFLKAAGGRWSRKAQAHVFKKDPREALGLALETGSIVSEQQRLQAFYTPSELADRVARLAQLSPGCSVLEPSAGEGALIKAALKVCPDLDITAYDINPDVIPGLLEMGVKAELKNFGDVKSSEKLPGSFDRIIMNPPFTRGRDVVHVLHAMSFLKPDGVLVAIVSPSAISGETKLQSEFQGILESAEARIEVIPAGAFKASGTKIETRLIVIEEAEQLWMSLVAWHLENGKRLFRSVEEDLAKRDLHLDEEPSRDDGISKLIADCNKAKDEAQKARDGLKGAISDCLIDSGPRVDAAPKKEPVEPGLPEGQLDLFGEVA